jgi:hypothetical protein
VPPIDFNSRCVFDFEPCDSDGIFDGIVGIDPKNIVLFQRIKRAVDDRVGVRGMASLGRELQKVLS